MFRRYGTVADFRASGILRDLNLQSLELLRRGKSHHDVQISGSGLPPAQGQHQHGASFTEDAFVLSMPPLRSGAPSAGKP